MRAWLDWVNRVVILLLRRTALGGWWAFEWCRGPRARLFFCHVASFGFASLRNPSAPFVVAFVASGAVVCFSRVLRWLPYIACRARRVCVRAGSFFCWVKLGCRCCNASPESHHHERPRMFWFPL